MDDSMRAKMTVIREGMLLKSATRRGCPHMSAMQLRDLCTYIGLGVEARAGEERCLTALLKHSWGEGYESIFAECLSSRRQPKKNTTKSAMHSLDL
eukprot:2536286-Amphidinium_carterae.1